jgi:hypothetical protein
MNEYYVYQLRVEGDELPFYVGKGHSDRAYRHLGSKEVANGNLHKQRKIAKARREGKEILVEFIEENLTEAESFAREIFWIAYFGRNDLGIGPLTNMTNGGEGMSGYVFSAETRKKLSAASKANNRFYGVGPMGGRTHSEETKALMSSQRKAENNAFFGKTHTEENRERMRQIKLANPVDSGRFEGKTHSAESRAQIGDSSAKVLYKVTKPDGTVEIVRNMRQYCRDNDLTAPNMMAVAAGKQRAHKGYLCERI